MDRKWDPTVCYLQDGHIKYKDAAEIRQMEKTLHANKNSKEAGVAMLASPKMQLIHENKSMTQLQNRARTQTLNKSKGKTTSHPWIFLAIERIVKQANRQQQQQNSGKAQGRSEPHH